MTVHNLHDLVLPAYWNYHTMETALLYVYNDLMCAVHGRKCVLLILLDLSATFDAIIHTVLLQKFEQVMGITGSALEWLKSYFNEREQSIHIEGTSPCKLA